MRRTTTSSRPAAADPTTAWARDVVDGRILAGELVRHAAQRHLRDLRDGPSRGLHWAPDRAARALGFLPAVLTITAGAKAGEPFHPLPWHVFVIGSLFGWRKDSGRMRFRAGWLETGKGQAKSPLMAAVGLYLMGWGGIPRSEIYAIGQDRATANVLFADAVAMCRGPIPGTEDEGETLEARGDVVIRGEGDNAWKIEHPDTQSKFRALANGEAVSGPRPTAVLADEIHEFKSNGPIETWRRAIAKMPGDALMLLGTNTPSTSQIVGTDYSSFYQKVAQGQIADDEAFAFIARVDKVDRETVFENEACWGKALPALGVTFPIENIRGEVNTAKQLLSTALSVKRLYFGIPVGATEFWIAEDAWAAVQGEVDPDEMKGRPCWLSLDLSKKNDLTALTAVWLGEDGHLYAFTWYWTVKEGIADRSRRDQAPYDQWVEAEHLTAVDGAVIDKTFVAAEVARIVAEHDVQFLAFDPAGIADFIASCEEIGLPVWRWKGAEEPEGEGLKLVAHAQGLRIVFEDRQLCMPRSVERLEDRVLHGGITIASSPVTYACAANAHLATDGQANLEQWLGDEVETEFARQEGIAFVSGNGVNKPFGLVTYVTGGANGLGDGGIDAAFMGALPLMPQRPVPSNVAAASLAQAAKHAPEVFNPLKWVASLGAGAVGIGGADSTGLFDQIQTGAARVNDVAGSVQGAIGMAGSVVGFIADHRGILLVAGGLYLLFWTGGKVLDAWIKVRQAFF